MEEEIVTLHSEGRQGVNIVRRFYAADPFGNRIEFVQDGDGLSQG